jgi:NAD(P)-dependent dehydrogenase (short-subunit alcohol dehydrogenase family)
MILSSRYLNKICLITGGTKGIGLATAHRFLNEQGTVIICSSREESVKTALNSFEKSIAKERVHAVKCDVTQKKERLQLLDLINRQYGRLDVLVLNHGVISHIGKQMEITESKFDEMINVNLKSCFFMI